MAKQNNNIPSGYKSSPLGLIPNDWEIGELSSVFEYINTPSFSRDNLTNEKTKNELYYIHYGDIHATYKTELLNFDIETKVPFLKDEFYSENFVFLKEGDLVIADASEDYEGVGECIEIKNINNRKVIGGLHTIVVRDNSKKTSPGFRTYIFRNKQVHNELKKIATGTSVYGISKGNLSKIKLPLPPLPEQKAIANLLNIWDDAIQNTNQLIVQKEKRKKWLMQQLLTGKKRLKGFEKEKWKLCTLGDLFERVTKKNTERNQTVVTISAQRGFVMQNDYFNKIIASDILDNYFLVEKGEFCYNKSYSNGYPWGATKRLNDFEKAVVTTLYICFKIKDTNKTSGDYFEHFFEVNSLDKGLMSVANEGGRAHGLLNVTATDFFNIEIKAPKFEEQEAIAKILSLSVNEIQLLQNKLSYLKEQKKGLMQVLLTGKKRLKINI